MDTDGLLTQTNECAVAAPAAEEPTPSSARRMGGLLLAGLLVGSAALAAKRSSAPETALSSVAPRVMGGTINGDTFTCNEYDDDDTYTSALCSQFDGAFCNAQIQSDFWCSTFCSDSCDSGEGAVCLYRTLSDLRATCDAVESMTATYASDAALSASPLWLNRGQKTSRPRQWGRSSSSKSSSGGSSGRSGRDKAKAAAEQFEGYGPDYTQADDGCAMHSFCSDCTADCASETTLDYLTDNFDGYDPDGAATALSRIDRVCVDLGYIADNRPDAAPATAKADAARAAPERPGASLIGMATGMGRK